MNTTHDATGRCLCGKVEIQANGISNTIGACHCNMCRKWSGGPFMNIETGGAVHIVGSDNVATYASSDWAERAFCATCGTHLYYRLKQNDHYALSAGLFAPDANLHFDHQIFIDEKPAWYSFANETRNMTGAEVFAQFSGDGEES